MRLDHIEAFNRASTAYREAAEIYIRECKSELQRAEAILGMVVIAESVEKPRPQGRAEPLASGIGAGIGKAKVVELDRGDDLQKSLGAKLDVDLKAG